MNKTGEIKVGVTPPIVVDSAAPAKVADTRSAEDQLQRDFMFRAQDAVAQRLIGKQDAPIK